MQLVTDDGESVHASPLLLVANSAYFGAMFRSDVFSESRQDTIAIHEMKGSVLRALVEHMCSGHLLDLDESNVLDFLEAGCMLQV